MLQLILQSLQELLSTQHTSLTVANRIAIFQDRIRSQPFSRKDYLNNFKEISSATASRDLRWAVEEGKLEKSGEKNRTHYRFMIERLFSHFPVTSATTKLFRFW